MRMIMVLAVLGAQVTGSGDTITGSGSQPGTSGGALPPGSIAVDVPAPVGAGSYCMHTVIVPIGTRFPPYNALSSEREVACPGAAPTPSQLASQWAETARLPRPTLAVAPGYAVTGLTAYLEIAAASTWTTTFANTIDVACTRTGFDVDWGDGSPVEQTTSTGGPYPAGDVTHAYQEATPALVVTVAEHWVCQWSGGGGRGTLRGLSSTTTLDLEVREIQGY
ncbi:MAG: hypothetical protein ACYDH6_18465 [Acidimicrobiales bacterium]